MIAKLDSVFEFCKELKREKDHIDNKIVRITKVGDPKSGAGAPRHTGLIATFVNNRSSPQIVRLDRHYGPLWGVTKRDLPTLQHRDEDQNTIETLCKEMGLEVRTGVFEQSE